jgi:hypothetical protein
MRFEQLTPRMHQLAFFIHCEPPVFSRTACVKATALPVSFPVGSGCFPQITELKATELCSLF